MANKKITELTALTSPASDDVLAIVDVSGTAETKKITVANLTAGGGGGGNNAAGSGGSGVVVVRGPSAVAFAGSPCCAFTGSTHPGGDKIAKFTASGTLTIAQA